MSSGTDSGRKDKERIPFLGTGMEWIVFSISLLVAVIIWLVYSLSLSYSTFLDFPVNITSNIPGYESRTEADQRLIVRGKATGFLILYQKINSGHVPLEVKVDGKYLMPVEYSGNTFAVATSRLRKEVTANLGSDMEVEYMVTDTLTFTLVPTRKKKVPVRADASLTCASQYCFYSDLIIKPDSVYISGKASMISSIDAVWTDRIFRTGIDGNIQGMVNLLAINGLDISAPSVMYQVDVKRFVEQTINVPVIVKNLPADRRAVVIPDHVDLTFRQWYPLYGRLQEEDFEVGIDYEKYIHSKGDAAIPEVFRGPSESFGYAVNPQLVECILINRQ